MNIVLIIYKIEKGLGSEDGTGYHLARRLIKSGDTVTLISRVNNIEKLKSDPYFKGVDLIGIDVPKPFSYFKRKGRGIIVYYYLWQIIVGRFVSRIQDQKQIDVIHQLNFHTDWAPHFIKKKKAKIIYGPINHHARVPNDFLFGNKSLQIIREFIKQSAKQFFWYIDPFVKRSVRQTDVVLYGNKNIAPPYQDYTAKIKHVPYGGSVFLPSNKKDITTPFQVLFVGRFIHLKGCIPAIDVFAQFIKSTRADAVMTFVGQGPLETAMKRCADEHGIASQVRFIPWLDQAELVKHYQSAHVFLYPSFEAQGLVVSEALSSGCPVICLSGTGPAYLSDDAGLSVEISDYQKTIMGLSAQLEIVHNTFQDKKAYQTLVDKSLVRYQSALNWDIIADRIRETYYDG